MGAPALEHLRERRFVGTGKEALGGGRAVGATDVVVVHGGERRELAIGAVAGHLFQARALGERQGVERMGAVAQRFEPLAAQRAQSVTRLGVGAARGDALQIQGWNQWFDEGTLQVGGSARASTFTPAGWRRKR